MADWYPTTAAEIITAVESQASDGDTVHIPAGTFVLPETMTIPENVEVSGAGKTKTTLSGIINSTQTLVTDELKINNLTIDLTGVNTGVNLTNGKVTLADLHIQGPATAESNNLSINATTVGVEATLTRVSSDDSSRDCIAFIAANVGLGAASYGRLFNCSASGPGPLATHNCLTTHTGFTIADYYGEYDGTGNQQYAVIPANANIILIGTRVIGHVTAWRLADCNITMTGIADAVVALSGSDAYCIRSRITCDATATSGITCNVANPRIESCRILSTSASTGSGILCSSLTTGQVIWLNNRIEGFRYAYNLGNGINVTGGLIFFNNTEKTTSTTPYAYNATTPPAGGLSAGYNTFQSTVVASYGGAQTGDALLTTPQYDGGYPKEGGNLDGTGDPTVDILADLDINGNPRLTGGTISRGPAEIPIVVVVDRLGAMRTFLEDLVARRDPPSVGGNPSGMIVELHGGDRVEMTAFEPDPATYRQPFYYNTERNVLYKRIVTEKSAKGSIASWRKVSI